LNTVARGGWNFNTVTGLVRWKLSPRESHGRFTNPNPGRCRFPIRRGSKRGQPNHANVDLGGVGHVAEWRKIYGRMWADSKFIRLSPQTRLTFIGLVTTADDEGFTDGHPAAVKATLFPADDVTGNQIAEWLSELVKLGMIRVHTWPDGVHDDVIELVNFKNHQPIRADRFKPSKLLSFIIDNPPATNGQPDGNHWSPRDNRHDKIDKQTNPPFGGSLDESSKTLPRQSKAEKTPHRPNTAVSRPGPDGDAGSGPKGPSRAGNGAKRPFADASLAEKHRRLDLAAIGVHWMRVTGTRREPGIKWVQTIYNWARDLKVNPLRFIGQVSNATDPRALLQHLHKTRWTIPDGESGQSFDAWLLRDRPGVPKGIDTLGQIMRHAMAQKRGTTCA